MVVVWEKMIWIMTLMRNHWQLLSVTCGELERSIIDAKEFVWRCILRKHLKKAFAIVLGCMSAAILLAEATMLTSGVDLSLFSVLLKSVGNEEVLVQVYAFVPLMYMCVCTYYSLFKVGMLMFYSLTPKQTSSVSLLMICSMVARYAPPISYNFLNLISFEKPKKTIFEQIFKPHTEADDMDGFDPSGLLILQRGCVTQQKDLAGTRAKVGEHVIPLVRNFNGASTDLESDINNNDNSLKMKMTSEFSEGDTKGSSSKPLKDDMRRYSGSKEVISSTYAAIREQSKSTSNNTTPVESIASAKVSLLNDTSSHPSNASGVPSGLASKWASPNI